MSVDTEKRGPAPTPAPVGEVRASGQLPRWAPPGLLVATAAVAALLLALVGFNIGLFVAVTVVLFAAALYLVSRTVEGPRKALDRFVTVVVSAAFLLALVPLVSLVITVVGNGVARLRYEVRRA